MAAKKTATKKSSTPKKYYIVVWDNESGDPVEVFSKLEEAQSFCTALVTGNEELANELGNGSYIYTDNVEKDSVKLYEGVLIGKAVVNVTFK